MQRLNLETLENILKILPAGIIVIEKDGGKASYANDCAIKLLGVDPRELHTWDYSAKFFRLMTLDRKKYSPEELPSSKSLLTGEEVKDELIIERADGSRTVVSVSSIPIEDKGGEVVAALGIFEDITERKKVEKALKESEERFRFVAEAADVLVYEFVFGTNEVLIERGLKDLLGYKPDNQRVKVDWWVRLDHPDDSQRVNEQFKASIKDRNAKGFSIEYRLRRQDGIYVTVSDTAKIIRDDFGKPIRIIGGIHNITERKDLQHKLQEYAKNLEKIVEERTQKIRESEQSFRELYESFGEAFMATDWEFNVIHWNKVAERVTKVAAKDALGKKIYDVLPEMLSVDFSPHYTTLQQKKTVRFMMNTVSRETGRPAIFEVSTYPSTQGIIVIVEDKTEEEQNKRLSAIGQTAGMVGHDIRNPLQAIVSELFLLSEEIKSLPNNESREIMQESVESIGESASYINKIVSDLQDYTRPLKPNIEEINVRVIVNSIITTANIPSRIKTEVIVEENLLLSTDGAYLRRALTNLVINAIQAMSEGGRLTINAFAKENKVIIKVEDTGVGIPEEVQAKIFTPLFTTKPKGQGLGLAVVKRLIEGLNGKITFESKEEKGTSFIIELPVSVNFA